MPHSRAPSWCRERARGEREGPMTDPTEVPTRANAMRWRISAALAAIALAALTLFASCATRRHGDADADAAPAAAPPWSADGAAPSPGPAPAAPVQPPPRRLI